MKELLKRIKVYFGFDINKVNAIIKELNVESFHGTMDELIYFDKDLQMDIFIIKNNKISINQVKKVYASNIGLDSLTKKEVKYLKSSITDRLITRQNEERNIVKNALLSRIGLSEEQFVFLIQNCK